MTEIINLRIPISREIITPYLNRVLKYYSFIYQTSYDICDNYVKIELFNKETNKLEKFKGKIKLIQDNLIRLNKGIDMKKYQIMCSYYTLQSLNTGKIYCPKCNITSCTCQAKYDMDFNWICPECNFNSKNLKKVK